MVVEGSCEEAAGGQCEGSDDEGFHLADFESAGLGSGDLDAFEDDEAMLEEDPEAAEEAAEAAQMQEARDWRNSTTGRNRLDVRLSRHHCGSMAAVKLIDGEDLRTAHRDTHPDTNIDVAAVAFRGRCVPMPPTVKLV